MTAPAGSDDVEAQYRAIRGGVGISDVSDLVKLRVTGPGAADYLDRIVAGNIHWAAEGAIRWTLLLDEEGRPAADVQVYREFEGFFLTCPAASGPALLEALSQPDQGVEVENLTDGWAAIAVEGPRALDLPTTVFGLEAAGLSFLRFVRLPFEGDEALVARIGFTAEFGYCFFVPARHAGLLVSRIAAATPESQLCGREVQDILRLEVRAFNMARDLLRGETALEAGLHWMLDFRKPDFRGREAVLAEKAAGLRRRLVGFTLDGRPDVARGAEVAFGADSPGYVANAGYSWALGKTVGLAYGPGDLAWVGVPLRVATADGWQPARVVSTPFLLTESTLQVRG